MPKSFSREGQLHFCCLITSLVDDFAINRGILTLKNVNLVLSFFIEVCKDPIVSQWINSKDKTLKINRCLQIISWLADQDVFEESNKSRMIEHMVQNNPFRLGKNTHSILVSMLKPIPYDVDRNLLAIFHRCLVNGF